MILTTVKIEILVIVIESEPFMQRTFLEICMVLVNIGIQCDLKT